VLTGQLPWGTPAVGDYETLLGESEYAAWWVGAAPLLWSQCFGGAVFGFLGGGLVWFGCLGALVNGRHGSNNSTNSTGIALIIHLQPHPHQSQPPIAPTQNTYRVLVNGYSLNHTALSVHRISPAVEGGLGAFNRRLTAAGFTLNGEGGLIKASPDGLLLQSSTVADVGEMELRGEVGCRGVGCGEGGGGRGERLVHWMKTSGLCSGWPPPPNPFTQATRSPNQIPTRKNTQHRRRVVQAYLEFVERKPLPQHASLPPDQLLEAHRRDGFEASSADNIFASTALAAKGV